MRNYLVIFSALLSWFAASPAVAVQIKPFNVDSYSAILKKFQGQPFIMAFWSVDCVPCMRELAMLGQLRRQNPDMALVMVSIDDESTRAEIAALLAKHGLAGEDQWVFSQADPVRLRYQIDNSWYGEVPRNYLFNQAHHRTMIPGGLECRHLRAWRNGDINCNQEAATLKN